MLTWPRRHIAASITTATLLVSTRSFLCIKKCCACALLGTITAAEQYYHTSTSEAYNTYFDLLAGNLATRSLTISRCEVATAFISARSLPVDAAFAVAIYDTQMNLWSRVVASSDRCPHLRKISSSRVTAYPTNFWSSTRFVMLDVPGQHSTQLIPFEQRQTDVGGNHCICSYLPTLPAQMGSRHMMKAHVTPFFTAIVQGEPGAGQGEALLTIDSEPELVPTTTNPTTLWQRRHASRYTQRFPTQHLGAPRLSWKA